MAYPMYIRLPKIKSQKFLLQNQPSGISKYNDYHSFLLSEIEAHPQTAKIISLQSIKFLFIHSFAPNCIL